MVEVARAAALAQPPVRPAGALRPLLGLRRLPDRALATVRKVVEEDELLRRATAQATTEELVGRASWLYLQRAEGWEAALEEEVATARAAEAEAEEARAAAGAVRRLEAVEASLRRVEEEAAALRAAAGEAKERLAEERRARRTAETEAGRLRQRVTELEAAEEQARQVAGLQAERDRLAARVAELEAADAAGADAATPAPAPSGPDVAPVAAALVSLDRTRDSLATWLDDARRAEEEVPRAEGATPGRRPPPAASRRRPAPLPPAVFADTVAAADHLLREPGALVLVDGYNVTKLVRPELGLPEQRRWLLDALVGLGARTGATFQVVFDGAAEASTAPAHGPRRAGVQVRYTQAGVEADDDLLALVLEAPRVGPVVLVSGDRRVRDGAGALGANVMGSDTFADVLRR